MKQMMYAMRRANGDWFAFPVDGNLRVPVFRSITGAWRVRAKTPDLMLFSPAPLDERALEDLGSADDGRPIGFWLVDEEDPAADLRLGHPLEYLQLATLEGVNELPRPRWRGLRRQEDKRIRSCDENGVKSLKLSKGV
jgi:hypothetical protein